MLCLVLVKGRLESANFKIRISYYRIGDYSLAPNWLAISPVVCHCDPFDLAFRACKPSVVPLDR